MEGSNADWIGIVRAGAEDAGEGEVVGFLRAGAAELREEARGGGEVAARGVSADDGVVEEGGWVGNLVEQVAGGGEVAMGGVGAEEEGEEEEKGRGGWRRRRVVAVVEGGEEEKGVELLGLGEGERRAHLGEL